MVTWSGTPAVAGMTVRTARPGTSLAVIPAKAGIHTALNEDDCAQA